MFANFEQLHQLCSDFHEALIYRQAEHLDYVHVIGDLLRSHIKAMCSPYMVYCANK